MDMKLETLYQRALNFEHLTKEEGMFLFENAPLNELSHIANELRKKQVPHGKVTWQIDRNLNTTNVCIANCKFCNFYRIPGHAEAYITDMDTYRVKIKETLAWGGDQLLLQGGHHPELGLDFNARAKQVFNNHLIQTRIALAENREVDFIVWPENAVDVDPYTNQDVYEELESFEKPLIIGAIVGKGENLRNTSILWGDKSQDIYVKQHLTPFGEYIPLRSLAKKISPLVNQVNDFSPGNGQKIFTIGTARIAPVICFELVDDDILAKAATSSNLLVVQTNSATFGTSAESAQQLSITRIRAIEHSRNVVSVSTTGISAVIDFNGKVLKQTSMGTAEHVFADVGLIEQSSPRDRYGDWAGVFTLIWLLVVARRAYALRR